MSQFRKPFIQSRRDAWVEINLAHIEHNIKVLKDFTSSDTKFLAVVKADAYGHGSTMTAPTLLASGVDMLGVASVDEGIQLRQSGIISPILVLGSTPEWAITSATEHEIQISIFTDSHINACIETYNRLKKKPQVHIKVDTGMNRIGLSYKDAPDFINKILNTRQIQLKGVFSHLACAECLDKSEIQKQKWLETTKELNNKNILKHLVNTAGLISYKNMHYDMVRAGIGIYGLIPDLNPYIINKPELKPAMSLKGRIIFLKEIEKENGVSYGHSFVTENEVTKIATIPIGYADGVPRNLSNKIYGLINGQKVKQIGNITMDQMMFDVSNVNIVETGDIITLIGHDENESIQIDEWANLLGTINYELTCQLKVRLPRIYTRDE
ncbi:MAG: alanine racemase [Candidatus Melainabacteria bacterium GWA2_34_9]|nr:MAG: alanine racemase [Candidatus Melainabacteria bacterium GWA2_34_9]